jgi:hypothetical protein
VVEEADYCALTTLKMAVAPVEGKRRDCRRAKAGALTRPERRSADPAGSLVVTLHLQPQTEDADKRRVGRFRSGLVCGTPLGFELAATSWRQI